MNFAEHVQNVDGWDAAFAADPDMMLELVADVVKIMQSQASDRVTGRRPAAQAIGWDELWDTLFPTRFSVEPLPVALRQLVGDGGPTAFARKVPCDQSTITQLVKGSRTASPQMMESLARAGGVTPAYFREWRVWRVSGLVAEALAADPTASAAVIKGVVRRLR